MATSASRSDPGSIAVNDAGSEIQELSAAVRRLRHQTMALVGVCVVALGVTCAAALPQRDLPRPQRVEIVDGAGLVLARLDRELMLADETSREFVRLTAATVELLAKGQVVASAEQIDGRGALYINAATGTAVAALRVDDGGVLALGNEVRGDQLVKLYSSDGEPTVLIQTADDHGLVALTGLYAANSVFVFAGGQEAVAMRAGAAARVTIGKDGECVSLGGANQGDLILGSSLPDLAKLLYFGAAVSDGSGLVQARRHDSSVAAELGAGRDGGYVDAYPKED